MPPESASRKNLPDEIVDQLQRRILSGEVRPGERLPPERELALQLGTNRNTLREALRALEAQGLVRARQGDGVRVLEWRSAGELGLLPAYLKAAEGDERARVVADLLRVRTMAALEAVTLASRRAPPEALERLRQLLQALLAAHRRGETAALAQAEMALYRAITEAAASLAGLWLFNSLEKVILGLLDASPDLWVTPECYREAWSEVVAALGERRSEDARKAMRRLLTDTDRILLGLLGLPDEAGLD